MSQIEKLKAQVMHACKPGNRIGPKNDGYRKGRLAAKPTPRPTAAPHPPTPAEDQYEYS